MHVPSFRSLFTTSLLTFALSAVCARAATPGDTATPPADTDATFSQPLTLIRMTTLPEIIGDFDHFAVDLKRKHLFVSAEVHYSVEMFDLASGKHLRSISGFKTPHSLAFVPEKDELIVADGGNSAPILVSAESLERIGRVPLIDGSATDKGDSPNAAFYDAQNRLYYLGNGGASANLPDSTISIFSVDLRKLIGSMSVPGNNVESMGVDNVHHRLYVNIRDKQQIGVFDLTTKQMLTAWTAPGMKGNTALPVDTDNERVFVAGREPGTLYVFDRDGKTVAQMPCVEINDDMTWDPAMKRLYVSETQGFGSLSPGLAGQLLAAGQHANQRR